MRSAFKISDAPYCCASSRRSASTSMATALAPQRCGDLHAKSANAARAHHHRHFACASVRSGESPRKESLLHRPPRTVLQERRLAGSLSGTRQSPRAGTRTCVAKPPSPSLPGINCRRQVVGQPARHAGRIPAGDHRRNNHGVSHPVAPCRPAATTWPAISCPSTSGRACRVGTPSEAKPTSVWQTPQPATLTMTSSAAGSSFGRSARSSGFPTIES